MQTAAPVTPSHQGNIRRASSLMRESTLPGVDFRQHITPNEEAVFQRMAYRKLERQLRGTYKNDKPWTILWTFLTLLLLFGLVAPNFVDYKDEENNNQPHKRSFDIQVNIRDLGFLSLMAVITVVTLVYTLTRVVVVVRWSLYWLLATLSVLYLWKRQINLFSNDTPLVLLIGFGVLEFLTFFVYILLNFLYPPLVRSEFFRKNVGVSWWFGIRPQPRQHWTLTYLPSTWFEGRRTCTYRGETDADGLPHGFGSWLDDSFHGELLSGMWERGVPVGPFRSREFGSGFAFESLRVAYVHCSDDSFVSRKWFPTQQKLPTLGVASVECSVAGGFFSHLPRAVIREGPYCLSSIFPNSHTPGDVESQQPAPQVSGSPYDGTAPHYPFRTVADILPHIKVLYTEHPSSSLIITATRGRGVLVSGHTYLSEGDPEQLLIDVVGDETSGQGTIPVNALAGAVLTPASGKIVTRYSNELQNGIVNINGHSTASGGNGEVTPVARVFAPAVISAEAAMSLPSAVIAQAESEEPSSVQKTDAPGSSLLLASDEDEVEEDEETEGGILRQLLLPSRRLSSSEASEEGEFHTPLLGAEDEASAEVRVVESMGVLVNGSNIEEEEEQSELFFNMSHIPAATFQTQLLQQQNHLRHRPHSNVYQESRFLVSQQRHHSAGNLTIASAPPNVGPMLSATLNSTTSAAFPPGPHLRVRGWKSTVDGHVEALVFFPGFNASLEHSLQRLGQFMAMGRFPPHIKPVVFSWPCGRELTYLWAAECATSKRTHAALAALLRGLEAAGVKDIHFLVHSLGAQVVCSALRDDDTSNQRSEVSSLFADAMGEGSNLGGNLRLRTLTLLNPDTPLSSFIHRDFKGLRRVCDHITVVGDRKDGALNWSELGNGLTNTTSAIRRFFVSKKAREDNADDEESRGRCCGRCGDPDSFCSRKPFTLCCQSCIDGCCRPYRHGTDRLFSRVLTLGRNVFSLYVRSPFAMDGDEDQPLLQRSLAAAFRRNKDGRVIEEELDLLGGEEPDSPYPKRKRNRRWLDVDVIDTSSMETNVHQLRHAYFDLNKILVEDLHELIVTGRRAAERSLLLHREGNIFSFCQAPACVVNQ